MTLRFVQVSFKALDAPGVGRFWSRALGWGYDDGNTGEINLEPVGFDYPDPSALVVDVIPVQDTKTGKNRVHLDLASYSAEHRDETVRRLTGLGASPVDVGQGEDVPWTVLSDPEGNEFCVLEPRDRYRNTGPIAAVVVDSADPAALARFWDEATDWTVHECGPDLAVLRSSTDQGPYLEFVRSPEPKTVVHRVHLDLRPYAGGSREAEAERLCGLGASPVDVGQGEDVPWTVLSDPEGNEFCVLTPK